MRTVRRRRKRLLRAPPPDYGREHAEPMRSFGSSRSRDGNTGLTQGEPALRATGRRAPTRGEQTGVVRRSVSSPCACRDQSSVGGRHDRRRPPNSCRYGPPLTLPRALDLSHASHLCHSGRVLLRFCCRPGAERTTEGIAALVRDSSSKSRLEQADAVCVIASEVARRERCRLRRNS